MKSHRSAFLSVALGLAVLGTAACEDKTEVVIPDPTDPITVNLVPDAITLVVGESADFAAVVSGGDDETVRTVSFSSGNDAVAEVSATGTVTANGTGTTTITATATADPNAKDVSTVTVLPEAAPPSISIKSITQFNTNTPVNINNAFGQIDVTLNVDVPPGNDVDAVQVLVEDVTTGSEMAVCTQSFSGGSASLEGDAAAQAVEIVCSFDSAAWDATTGVVTHLNGPKILRALLVAPDGEILATVETQIIFNNQNFISAAVSGSNGSAISQNGPQSVAQPGLLWYGGAITVNMISVNYVRTVQGQPDQNLSSATVSLTSSGSGVTGVGGCTTTGNQATDPTIGPAQGGAGLGAFPVTGTSAGGFVYSNVFSTSLPGCPAAVTVQQNTTIGGNNVFSVTFPTNASMAAGGVGGVEDAFLLAISSVTVGGQPGPVCINPNPVNNPLNLGCPTGPTAANAGLATTVNIDNLAPRVPQLNIVRPSQYYSFQVPNHAITSTGAPCTSPCARTVDYGVDRQNEAGNAVFMAGTTTGNLVDVTAGLGILAETPSSAGATAYLFQLVVKDALGNTRSVFASPTATIVVTAAGGALRFGIDQTLPTETLTGIPDMWTNSETTLNPAGGANCTVSGTGCDSWSIAFIDAGNPATGGGPSGFNANPVNTLLELVTPAGTTCYNPNNAPATPLANCATVPDDGQVQLPVPGTDGYWRITVTVTDAAGNTSDPQSIVLVLSDHTAPSFTGGVVVPSVIAGGSTVAANATMTDNVELGQLTPIVEFDNGNGGGWFGWTPTMIGDWDADDLAANSMSTGALNLAGFPRSLETTTGAGLPTGAVVGVTGLYYRIRDVAGFQLRYVQTPWQAPADADAGDCPVMTAPAAHPSNAATQNCSMRSIDITPNSLAGMPTPGTLVTSQYTALVTANGLNALYGLFVMQAPSAAVICNNTPLANCTAATPTSTTLSVTLTGQNAVFLTPFTSVKFYYQNQITGSWELIGETSAPAVTDNTVLQLRTYTYSMTWDATNLKVRPAGNPGAGVAYPVLAVGTNATGDWLVSTVGVVAVEGN